MIKKYSLVLVACFCFVLSGFGQTAVTYSFASPGALTTGILDSNISFSTAKNNSGTNPGIFSNQLRLYQNAIKGGSIIITSTNGVTITKVVVNASGTTGPAGYMVDGGTATNLNASTTYTMSSLSATSQLEFYQRDASSGNRIYVDSFEVTYTSAATGPTVTYNGNGSSGGSVPTDASSPYTSGATVTVLGNTGSLTKNCSTFNGWTIAADGSGTVLNAADTFTIAANTTLYAKWTSTGKTVTFDNNTGAGTMTPQVACASANLTTNTFTKASNTFSGWNTAADNSGIAYADGASYAFTADVTLYAQWTPYVGPCLSQLNFTTTPAGWAQTNITYAANEAKFESNTGELTTLAISNPNLLTFDLRRSSNSSVKSLIVEISTTTLGGTYATIANYDHSNTASSSTTSCTVDLSAYSSFSTVYIRFRKVSSTSSPWYLKNVEVFCGAPTPQKPSITSDLTKSSEYGAAASYSITADYLPTSFGATGLPTGLSVNTTTGLISGTVTAGIGNYNVAIEATNAQGTDSEILVWTITKKSLTISGLSGGNKVYNGNTTATVTGTAALSGVVSGDTVTLSGTPTVNYNNKDVGNNKPITMSGYNLSGADAGNYTLTQPTGLTGNITAKALTVTGATAQNKPYDGTTTATIAGATLNGVISLDVVTVSGGGAFANANVGTGIAVTANLTLAGVDAGNYSLTQPTGLSANITAAAPTFTTSTINITVGGNYTLPGANISSNSGGTLSYTLGSVSPSGSVILTGNSLDGIAEGTATLTVNQVASGNYTAGSTTIDVIVTTISYANGDYRTNPNFTNSIYFASTTSSVGIYPWQKWNGSNWVDVTGSSATSAPENLTTKPDNIYIITGVYVDVAGGGTYNNIILNNASATLFSGNTSTGLNIAAGKTLDIKAGYFSLTGKFSLSANSNLIVRTDAEFEISSSSFNFLRNATSTFTVEDEGWVFINSYLANIWNGNENFAGESILTIYGWNRDYRLFNNESDISNNSVGSKFGYLFLDLGTSGISGNWTYVLPSSGTYTLTNKDFEITNSTSDNMTLNPGTVTIGGDFLIDGSGNVQGRGQNGAKIFNVKGNFVKNGTGTFRLNTGTDITNPVRLNVDGNFTVNKGFFIIDNGATNLLSSEVNLGGNLTKLSGSYMTNSNTNSPNIRFNFVGNPSNTPQLVNLNVGASNDMLRFYFFIKNGAYVQPSVQDWKLATSSKITVESGGTLDFGFNNAGTLPLNVITNGTQQQMLFESQAGSTLKITSTDGITTNNLGNVQIPAAGRTYSGNATFHYIGKANQFSGNGLPNTTSAKKVIVELDLNTFTFQPNGLKNLNGSGNLEIRKGIVLDNATGGFTGAGSLTMNSDDGRYRLFTTGTNPGLEGNYNLTAGVVEFASSQVTAQTIRSPKSYQNIEVTGSNVGNSSGNITLNDSGSFTVKNSGIFEMSDNSIVGPTGNQTLTVESTGVFKCAIETGFYGAAAVFPIPSPAIRTNIETIIFEPGSTVNYSRSNPPYAGDGSQTLTKVYSNGMQIGYQNLIISGTGTKSIGSDQGIDVNENLSVQSSSLQIDNSKYIKVQDNVSVSGDIYIAAQGALVQVDNSGTFTLNSSTAKNTLSKYTHNLLYWYDYTYWSSPLANAQIETALFQSKANRRFKYDASLFNDTQAEIGNTGTFNAGMDDIDDNGDDWVNQPSGLMMPGTGYAATHNNSFGFISGTSYQYIFEGTQASGGPFNTGNITVPIYIDPSVTYNNWNLIGNPYPSAISALKFFEETQTNLEGVIYLWSQRTDVDPNASGNEGNNFSQEDYAMINYTGSTAASLPSPSGSNIPNDFIPSGQGFFVIGKKSGVAVPGYITPVVFTNAMRDVGNNNQFFRTDSASEANKLWIDLTSNNGIFSQILIGYVDGATDDFDGMHYDAYRNLSTASKSILYMNLPNTDKKFAIQGKNPNSLSLDEIIPLGFYTNINVPTTYRLSIEQLRGEFLTNNTIYLKDNLQNFTHNLSVSDYVFSSEPGEFNTRFEIVFKDQALSVIENEITPNGLSIIELQNGQVKFSVGNSLIIQSVEIFDMLGRRLYNLKGDSPSEVYELTNVSQAAYMAKVTLSNGQVITKRAVKQQ